MATNGNGLASNKELSRIVTRLAEVWGSAEAAPHNDVSCNSVDHALGKGSGWAKRNLILNDRGRVPRETVRELITAYVPAVEVEAAGGTSTKDPPAAIPGARPGDSPRVWDPVMLRYRSAGS